MPSVALGTTHSCWGSHANKGTRPELSVLGVGKWRQCIEKLQMEKCWVW